ncbi:hypothetical protein Tco_1461554 [Tanacetum coccineum]
MYAMTCTRPDIAYVIGKLNRHTNSLGKEHWDAVNQVFNYLKKTIDYGLKYNRDPSVLEDSTMAAEFVALASCCKEEEWLRDLLINIPLWPKPMPPISVHYDSQSTLSRAYNQVYNGPYIKGLPRKLIESTSYGNNLVKVHLSECGSGAASYELRYRPKASFNGSTQSGLNEREEGYA